MLASAFTVPDEVFAGFVPPEALSTVSAVTVYVTPVGRLGFAVRDVELTPGKDES